MRRRLKRWVPLVAACLCVGCSQLRTRTYEEVPPFQNISRIVLADSTVLVARPHVATLEGDSVVVRHRTTLERSAAWARDDIDSVIVITPVTAGEVMTGTAIVGMVVLVLALE